MIIIMKKYLKKKNPLKCLKILGLNNNIEEYQKIYNHVWRKQKSRFRLKNMDETRNYLFKEITQNELMSKKH